VTGGGLGVDLDDLDSYSSKITTDVVDDDQLYDIPLERVISSATGLGKWVAGGDGSGVTFVPEAPEDGLQYGRENGAWTEIDAGGVWDSDGIEDANGNATGHYYHLSNAENTNIFKTTIGSDEVEMMGLTSISAGGYLDQDGTPILTGYATEDFVTEAIGAIPPVDLDGYATEEYVNANAIKVGDGLAKDQRNDVEATFQIIRDDSGAENTTDLLYINGTRGTFSIGHDGAVAFKGDTEIRGESNEIGGLPYISNFQSVQANDGKFDFVQAQEFVDAYGNSIIQPPAPVASVNGKTGAVSLSAADVGALPTSYTPPEPDVSQAHVKSAASLKGNEHGFSIGLTPGFGQNLRFVFGSSPTGQYDSSVMLGNSGYQFAIVYSAQFYKGGSPMLAADDLIDTFTTIKSAITEETTVEGLRSSVVSGLDAVIQKLQAMEDKAEEEGHKS
jgi:hypothetical protein